MTFIWTERALSDGTNIIAERIAVSGEPSPDFKHYRTGLQRPTGLSDPQGRPLMAHAEVEFDATSPDDAFAKLPQLVAAFEKDVKGQAARAMLATPPPKGFDPNRTPPNGFRPKLAG